MFWFPTKLLAASCHCVAALFRLQEPVEPETETQPEAAQSGERSSDRCRFCRSERGPGPGFGFRPDQRARLSKGKQARELPFWGEMSRFFLYKDKACSSVADPTQLQGLCTACGAAAAIFHADVCSCLMGARVITAALYLGNTNIYGFHLCSQDQTCGALNVEGWLTHSCPTYTNLNHLKAATMF